MTRAGGQVRVVVTGLGAVTPMGASAADLWSCVRAGRVGIREVTGLPMAGYRTRIGGEVGVPVAPGGRGADYPRPPGHRERAIDLALAAAAQAVGDSGLRVGDGGGPEVPAERWGVVMGSCNAGLLSGRAALVGEREGRRPDWRLLLLVPPQAIAESVAADTGARGPVLSVNTACASGAHAIGHATDLIRSGRADVVLAGGSDAFSDVLFAGFNSLESLSPEPAAPYSRGRQGLSLGEGSGVLVLARQDLAERAGAAQLAEVLGWGSSADGYHATAPRPDGAGAARAMTAALADAGLVPHDVAYVNGHGTGTAKNDPAESRAIRRALGTAADSVAVSSTKSMIGHLLGAAGAVEGIVTVQALQEQVAPPTAGFTAPDEECGLDVVPNTARPLAIDVALSNNFAFAGANATVALAAVGPPRRARPERLADPVVVTGLGALTPQGAEVDDLWRAWQEPGTDRSAEGGLRVLELADDPGSFLLPRQRRRVDRLSQLAVVTARRALEHGRLAVGEPDGERVAVLLGTAFGPAASMEDFTRPLLVEGAAAANPALFPNTVWNAAAGQVAMRLDTRGPTSTLTGHAAGASVLAAGLDLLQEGRADAVVCLAVDTLTPLVVRTHQACAPLRRSRYVLAEAGFALLLERASTARARGAVPLGVLAGYGIAGDATGPGRCAPDGEGLERAVRAAVGDPSGLARVRTVWANAAGVPGADAAERRALDRLWRAVPVPPVVHCPKLVLGEAGGTGGALGAVLALTAWRHGAAPAPALVTSSSYGGTHVAVLLEPHRTAVVPDPRTESAG